MKLSPSTRRRVAILFAQADVEKAVRRIEMECGTNLPMCDGLDSRGLERIRFAVLKLSDGSLARLEEAIAWAKLDWRDLLVAAEFAVDTQAHTRWCPRRTDG